MLATFKNTLIDIFLRLLKNDRIRLALAQQLIESRPQLDQIENQQSPYITISNKLKKKAEACDRDDIIFITGRFRSGSTLVWNMFRQIPTVTSYYEPLNERKWFLQQNRGNNVDSTHIGVEDYWREFEGMDKLNKIFDENWIRANLYMDSSSWNPKLKEYICELVNNASGRPVLQFNRVDFRLPWLRHHFPNAKFLHVFRNPRDQWLSFLGNTAISKEDIEFSFKDYFYLNNWCEDLAAQFPFLSIKNTPHPYQRFYYLWKLSYLYGIQYSDLSTSFEDLVTDKELVTKNMINTFGLNTTVDTMTGVIATPTLNRWKNWANDSWYSLMESECEKNLDLYLKTKPDDHSSNKRTAQ